MRDWGTMNWEQPAQFLHPSDPGPLPDLPFRRELRRPPAELGWLPDDLSSWAICAHLRAQFADRAIGLSATANVRRATRASRRRCAIRLVPRNTSTPGLR